MTDFEPVSHSVHLADVAAVADDLVGSIRDTARRFRRAGAVVAVSGGVDSSVSLALAVRALGADRVVGISLPDQESDEETLGLAREVAGTFGARFEHRDITAVLDALGCYRDRLAVVQRIDPGFDPAVDAFSVEFEPATGEGDRLPSFALNIVRAGGEATHHRLGGRDFLTIMAATNQKQRVRMLVTYRLADEENLLVVGTSNRLELDQGFFVKHGDGCGEVFPLRHLLKSQIYDLAEYLRVPASVLSRPPTTDTFSAPQTQEQYFYGASVERGDELWLAWYRGDDPAAVAARLAMTETDVGKFFQTYRRRAGYADYLTAVL